MSPSTSPTRSKPASAARTLLRLLRREPLEHDLSHAAVGLSSLWFTLSWLVGGLAVWVMARNVAAVIAAAVDDPATIGKTYEFNDGSTPIAEALG